MKDGHVTLNSSYFLNSDSMHTQELSDHDLTVSMNLAVMRLLAMYGHEQAFLLQSRLYLSFCVNRFIF